MATLARCNGTLLIDDDGRLGVVEPSSSVSAVGLFVSCLITFILTMNGVVQLFLNPLASAVLLPLALVGVFVSARFVRRYNALLEAPLAGPPWLVFDLEARVLRREGDVVAPLDQVRLRRAFQATSSSKALLVDYPNGSVVIARGTPFGDSVVSIEDALRARGIRAA